MTTLYCDPIFGNHLTGSHPERPARLTAINRRLEEQGLVDRCHLLAAPRGTMEQIARWHSREYIESLEQYAAAGGGRIEADTVVSPQSFDVALHAAGAACDGVQRVVAGKDTSALCLIRPPGHHALVDAPMGFCLFNNVALAAKEALAAGLDRVLIVDWDVHHGNGTQDAFWDDEQVGFFSSHRYPFYPGSGAANETGSGAGLGFTRNLPLRYGTDPAEFLAKFESELNDFAARVQPQLVLVSAGFDAHREDPVGSLDLETEDFGELTRIVQQVAAAHAGGRIVSLLEGGYHVERLADSVAVHLEQLLAPAGC